MFVLRRRQAVILDLSPDLHLSPDQQLHALLRRRDRVVRPQRCRDFSQGLMMFVPDRLATMLSSVSDRWDRS